MKKVVINIFYLFRVKIILIGLFFIIINPVHSQIKKRDISQFEVINRRPLNDEQTGVIGMANNNPVMYKFQNQKGKPQYSIATQNGTVSLDALSNVEYASKADRIVVFGDSLDKHIAANAYANIYSGRGALVRSLGLVAKWPFIATLSESGSFVIAGNKNNPGEIPAMYLVSFDRNGNKNWETNIPTQTPANIFTSYDGKYIALVLYDSKRLSGSIQYYDASGALLFTDANNTSVSNIEFLPSEKVVISRGNMWNLYDLNKQYSLIASGVLRGNVVGKYPVSVYPGKSAFIIVSSDESCKTNNCYSVQQFSSMDGTLLAQSELQGKMQWQPYRQTEVVADGTIRLIMSQEIVTLKMKE